MVKTVVFRAFYRVLMRTIFVFTVCVFCLNFSAFGEYSVTYDCGYYGGTAPSGTTATIGTQFTPPSAAPDCNQLPDATLTGWLVSGTEDVKLPDTSFNWEYPEGKTLTAVWSCYPDINNECVEGYKITLSLSNSNCRQPMYPMEPTVLYTIPTRGAYLDQARTRLMTKTTNPMQLPHVEFILSFDTNAPQNPENGTLYNVTSVPSVNLGNYQYLCIRNIYSSIYEGHGWNGNTCFVHNDPDNYTNPLITDLTSTDRDGYLTDAGIYEAENQYGNQNWAITGCGWTSLPYIASPSLTGYTFENWCTDTAGTTSCFRGPVPDDVQNHIYYAHWTPKQYTVTYNCDGGTVISTGDTTTSDTATFDSSYDFFDGVNTCQNQGYAFTGWECKKGNTIINQTTNAQYWKVDGDVTCTAQWTKNTYTVTYMCSGNSVGAGTPPVDNNAYEYNASVTTPTIEETIADGVCYNNSFPRFNYWKCNRVTVQPGDSFNITEDTICESHWSHSVEPIRLLAPDVPGWANHFIHAWIFKGAHLSDTDANTFMTTTDNPLTPSDIPSRTGYVFEGYYSETQGNSTQPIGTQWIGQDGHITSDGMEESKWIGYLDGHPNAWYAGWTPKKYNITYNANGHGSYTDGYDATTNIFGPGRDNGGGTYGQMWRTKAMGTSHIIANNCELFCGWSADPNDTCGGQNIFVGGQDQGIWNYTSDITLYAIWQCNAGCANNNGVCVPIVTHNVTYNQGNCIIPKGAYLEESVPEGQYSLASEDAARITPNGNSSCCHFDGWSLTDPTTSEAPVELILSPVDLTSDMTVYGVCNCDTVTVIYHGCGGTTFTDNPQGLSFNVLPYGDTGLSSQGFTFENKWNTDSDGSGASYAENSVYTVKHCDGSGTMTVDLYAICTQNAPDTYTLHYVVNPGNLTYTNQSDLNLNDVSLSAGDGHSLSVVPTATGYICSDWECLYENDNLNISLAHPSGSITMPPADVTCTSNCTVNVINLLWDTNGGSAVSNSSSCVYGSESSDENAILLGSAPTKKGYIFEGWLVTDYFPGLSAWDTSINGSAYMYKGIGADGNSGNPANYHWFNDYYQNPESSTWAVFFYNDEHSNFIMGQSGCSIESGGAQYAVGSPNINNYNSNSVYCWCRVTSYVYDLIEVTQQSYPWVFLDEHDDNSNCKMFCAGSCAEAVRGNQEFRSALYGQTE